MQVLLEDVLSWNEAQDVHYLVIDDEIKIDKLLPEEVVLLEERYHPRRQKRFCQGRWGVREALRRAGYKEGLDVPILMDSKGKGVWGTEHPPKISFSISHYHQKTLVAIAPQKVSIGVDMEAIDRRFQRPIERIMTIGERNFLKLLDTDDRDDLDWGFTAIWVAKESVAKACGLGWMAHQRDFPLTHLEKYGRDLTCRWEGSYGLFEIQVKDSPQGLLGFAEKK